MTLNARVTELAAIIFAFEGIARTVGVAERACNDPLRRKSGNRHRCRQRAGTRVCDIPGRTRRSVMVNNRRRSTSEPSRAQTRSYRQSGKPAARRSRTTTASKIRVGRADRAAGTRHLGPARRARQQRGRRSTLDVPQGERRAVPADLRHQLLRLGVRDARGLRAYARGRVRAHRRVDIGCRLIRVAWPDRLRGVESGADRLHAHTRDGRQIAQRA